MENDIKRLSRLALDSYRGNYNKFSKDETNVVLRNALVELNGGKTSINRKAMRDGASSGLFALIETILQQTVREGLQGDEFFTRFVDYRNVALGDKNEFVVDDNQTLFRVDRVARGTGSVRRQRIGERVSLSIPTVSKAIRIYDELDRALSGRATINDFIDRVGKSFIADELNEIYKVFSKLSSLDLGSTLYRTGTFDSDELLDLIEHVEAKTGARATILGTIRALRKLAPVMEFIGESAKVDMYNMGYFGMFAGTPTLRIAQRYVTGTDSFMFPADELYVVAGDEQFIKYVTEGDPIIDMRTGVDNISDLTQEYLYVEQTGVGVVLVNDALGKYVFS